MIGSLRTYWMTAVIAFLLAILLFLAARHLSMIGHINIQGRDIFFRLYRALHPPPQADDIVMVNLDDETLLRLEKRWPYPRSLYAEALGRLRPYSPRAIGFDLVFSGDDLSIESDLAFSEALKTAGNVVIASYRSAGGEMNLSSIIRESAWQVGIVDKPRDRDHVIRRAFLTVQIGGESHPSWELALFRKAFPFSKAEEFPPAVRDVAINYRLRFNEFPHIPFWRLLEGNVLDKEIRNKIILFGLTAEVFHDIHTTPLGSMPGLAVNANVLLMLIKDSFFSSVPAWVVMALTFLSFWLILLMALSGSFAIALLTVSFLILLYLATSFLLFSNQILLDLWLLAVGMILALISAFLFQGVQLFFENLKLREEAVRDPLTGFYNRRFLVLKLKSEFKRMALKRGWPKNGLEISVVMMDLDNFKLVNDSFGHAEGDRVLSVMAQAICSSVRKNELICRYGGDEFCVILIGISIQDAVKFAEKIRGIIAGNSDLVYRTADRVATIRVTASIGVASVAGIKAIEPEKLLKAADRALYRAKSGGRNQVCVFDPARDVIT